MAFEPKHASATGRGAGLNPKNRFEALEYVPDPEVDPSETGVQTPGTPRTQLLRDDSQSIISWNDSPDIPFRAGLNPYRGCEHGCAYCFARPTHEYLGFSAGLDFESRILVKERAPELLRAEFSKKSWEPQPVIMSGVTDCYQPIERRLEITRRCLEVFAQFRNPVALITKNHLITRDIDYLGQLVPHQAVMVNISLTTLDPELAKHLEPRASPPTRRLAAIQELHAAGIPVNVMMAPVIPGLNDHEMPALLEAAARAGADDASYTTLRLPLAVAPIFEQWLQDHAPGHKEKVLNRIRSMHGGRLYDPTWGKRMRGQGIFADQIRALFTVAKKKAGFPGGIPPLSSAAFKVPSAQMDLF